MVSWVLSVSCGKHDPSQSLQMIERPLLTPDELKSLPKGTFVVMKTGFHPMQVRLKLFFAWGIRFPKECYTVAEKGNRKVTYASREELEKAISKQYVTERVEKTVQHVPMGTEVPGRHAFQRDKKPATAKEDAASDNAGADDNQPMAERNIPIRDAEPIFDETGEIIGEKLREHP